MDTFGKLIFGIIGFGLALAAFAVVAKFAWELGPVAVVGGILLAIGYLALRKPKR